MKNIKIILIIFLCLALNSCTREVKTEDYPNLIICGVYAVPGVFHSDLKGMETDYKIIETDAFGRVLFEFIAPCFITGQSENIYVICQKADTEYIYYYEDICFLFKNDNRQSVNSLKELNDWNKDLNIDKMTKRPILISFDGFIMRNDVIAYSDILSICRKELGLLDVNMREVCIDDVDTQGNGLFYLKSQDKTKEYFMFVSTTLEYDLFEISDFPLFDIEGFSQFKKANEWR